MNKHKLYLITSLLCSISSFAQTKAIIPLSNYTLPVSSEKAFYLTGEYHGVASNNKVEEHFYRELIQKHNVRTITIEGSVGDAYLINKYLNTGDTVYLNLYTSVFPQKYKEIKDKIITLRTLNDNLMPDDKVTVFGVDVIEDDRLPFVRKFFEILIKEEINNTELKQQLNILVHSDSFPNNINEIKKTLQHYNKSIDFTTEIDEVVNSYLVWQQVFKTNFHRGLKKVMKKREKHLYQNTLKNQPLYKGNMYADFGSDHLRTSLQLNKKLTAYLLNDPSFKYSIITYMPFYYNCQSSKNANMKEAVPDFNSLESKVKNANLTTGIYFTEHKKKRYIIHVNQPAMTEIK